MKALRLSLLALVSACSANLSRSEWHSVRCDATSDCPGELLCLVEQHACVVPGAVCVVVEGDHAKAAANGIPCDVEGATGIV